MLKIKILDTQATLNNFKYLEVKEYIPNKPFSVNFQILDAETNQRLIPGSAGTVNVVFQVNDGSSLTKAASKMFATDDRSMWTVAVTGTESNTIVGSNFEVDLDFTGNASDVRVGMAYGALSKITFDGEC